MVKKITSTFLGASFFISVIALLSKGLGFFREIIFANFFGLSKDYDLFLIAFTIPLIIYTTITYVAQNYFIPLYKSENYSPELKRIFFTKQIILFLIGGIAIQAILYYFSFEIMGLFFSDATSDEVKIASRFFNVLGFVIPIISLSAIITAYLYSNLNFHIPAFSRLIMNIGIIIFTLVFYSAYSIFVIPYAFVCGMFIQLMFLILFIIKDLNVSLRKIANNKTNYKLLLITIGIEVFGLSFIFIDRLFFEFVDEGGISALSYAHTLYILPINIFVFGITTVLLPKISNLNSQQIYDKIRPTLQVIIYFVIPISGIFLIFGDEIIKIVFQRGEFTNSDSILAGTVLRMYSIGLVFAALLAIVTKWFYAQKMQPYLLLIIVFGSLFKLLLNYFLVKSFKQNGLAISSVLTIIFMCILSYLICYLKILKLSILGLLRRFFIHLINMSMSIFIVLLLMKTVEMGSYGFVFASIFVTGLYIVNSYFYKSDELLLLTTQIKKALGNDKSL